MEPYFTEEDMAFENDLQARFDYIVEALIYRDGPIKAITRLMWMAANAADDIAYAAPTTEQAGA